MKIKKFEGLAEELSKKGDHSYEEELKMNIQDLIHNEVLMESVPYSDGDTQISYKSIEEAAQEIVNYLKENGLVEFIEYKKYNL